MVAIGKDGRAFGDLFLDDGESLDTIEQGNYKYITFAANAVEHVGKVLSEVIHDGWLTELPLLGNITILGLPVAPSKVEVNGKAVQFTYNEDTNVLALVAEADIDKQLFVLWE